MLKYKDFSPVKLNTCNIHLVLLSIIRFPEFKGNLSRLIPRFLRRISKENHVVLERPTLFIT